MKHRKKLLLLIMILVLSLFIGNSYAGKCACEFTRYSDDEGGLFKVKSPIIFAIITKPGSELALKITTTGTIPVLIIPNTQGGLSLMEITSSGGVAVTTMDIHGNAVHSRNTIIKGILIPSQYYGTCECIADKE